jgi:hypothetical protein
MARPTKVEVCARPGDAVFFDRRLWQARSVNHAEGDLLRVHAALGGD